MDIPDEQKVKNYHIFLEVSRELPHVEISLLFDLISSFHNSSDLISFLKGDDSNYQQSNTNSRSNTTTTTTTTTTTNNSNNNNNNNHKVRKIHNPVLDAVGSNQYSNESSYVREEIINEILEWGPFQVCEWLKNNNVLGSLIPIFGSIDKSGLALLEIDDIEEKSERYGIYTFGLKKNLKYEMNRTLGRKNPITENLNNKKILDLNMGQVSELLRQNNLSTLVQTFEENHINGIALLYLKNDSLDINSTEIFQRNTNILGVDFSYAVADIKVDQDIYLYDLLTCSSFKCPDTINSTIDCSCDYTEKGNCPKVNPLCNKECPDNENYQCDGDWIVLEQMNKEYEYTINTKTQFRFKANGTHCNGISLKVTSISGYGYSSIGSNLLSQNIRSNNERAYGGEAFQRNINFNICPNDNIESFLKKQLESWTTDTYFIVIEPIEGSFTFSLIINSIEIKDSDPSAEPCQIIHPSHRCINLNEQNLLYISRPIFFTLQITKPDYYYISLPNVDSFSVLYISDDENNKYPDLYNSTYQLLEQRENKLLLYLEPINSTHPLILYIRLAPIYASGVIFSVNNYGIRYQYPLSSSRSVQAGYFDLRATSKLLLNEKAFYTQNFIITLSLEKSLFFNLFPQKDLNPVYQDPYFIGTKIKNVIPSYNSFKPKSFQISFLLDKKSNLFYEKYLDFETLEKNSTFVINQHLFNKEGKQIKLIVKFKSSKESNECISEEYKEISNLMNNVSALLLKSSNEIDTNSYRFALDTLLNSNAWLGCQNKINSFYQSDFVQIKKSISNCPYTNSNDPLYISNPCCNKQLSYYQCCNPFLTTINSTKNIGFNYDLINDQCSSKECTISVLSEYNKTILNIDECSTKALDLTVANYSVVLAIRECKDVLAAPHCSKDSDCINYGSKKCDLYQRVCESDFEVIDREYIKCVLKKLPIGTLFYFINGTTIVNETTINNVYHQHLSLDCIGRKSIYNRSTYSYIANYQDFNCKIKRGCLDSTCMIDFDVCYLGYSFQLESKEIECSSFGYCPSLPCENSEECRAQCDSVSSFCGYCSNDKCYSLENKDQTSCQSQNICILPNGSYLTNVTSEKECRESYGKCTHGCGKKCVYIGGTEENEYSGCFSNDQNQFCVIAGGNFSNEYGICFFQMDKEECEASNFIWTDCSNKPLGDCAGDKGSLGSCFSKDIECTSEQQCKDQSGICSDDSYFKGGSITLSNSLGRCVRPPNDPNYFCNPANHRYSPLGCYLFTAPMNKEQCSEAGFKWWKPSINKDECLSHLGCKILVPFGSSYSFYFNGMDKDQCLNCNNSLNEFTNKFAWEEGEWLPGIYVSTQWFTTPTPYVSNQIKKTFNYELFYSNIKKALGSQNSELYRTESLCRIERIRKSLDSLVCSCGDGSSCFESSIPVIGITKVCPSLQSNFSFEIGRLEFSNDSIQQTCQTLTISQINKGIYTSTVSDSLASNFVSYNKPDNFAVLNSKKAIIGTLISDGIMISSRSGISNINICFKISTLSETINKKYTVLDIAIQKENQSIPTPLNLDSYKVSDFYCTNVLNVPEGNPIYFQINRLVNWENNKKELFDQQTIGLMYTLAVLFLLVSLFGFYQVITIIYLYIKKVILSFQLIQLITITVTVFITIRSVEGKLLNNPILDYILVVLPTFIYFSTFSIVLSLWFMIVYLVQKKNRNTVTLLKRLHIIVLFINVLLYLFFIGIILIYQYSKVIPDNQCGTRLFIPSQISNTQKAISISYAVVQSIISLVFAILFVYLGRSLYKTLSLKSIKTLSNSDHQQKIFVVSIVCSIGFILHCIFVLVLVSNINSIVFSFIGLVITELAPTVALLYCFNPGTFTNKIKEKHQINSKEIKKISSNSSNNPHQN
ncbi:hypothetical protein DICPUDRAFT_96277 [Dictyostelium purpureum]|uniref:THH1/TOM1/TOM3 domain-containing protein n=1 Tax=Dictyostelium purpureum TaxID=5786 RepID=F0Z6R2_DICPU|nr:uncharacterized protein DICPUDRAFT_96277 [Dictyostelium purpureum]EGC40405.1 hypothetical protein DICPUDRAFT_96277 [Dictyostelium purpureum]|eukprot:XP_003283156.1 hypothetical protein DICPUDRAFT_96277 [Dictyostelium purpureum]